MLCQVERSRELSISTPINMTALLRHNKIQL